MTADQRKRLRMRKYNNRGHKNLRAALVPVVASGQAIGETGDTGMTGENTLYFELREGTEPVDPLQWLARR